MQPSRRTVTLALILATASLAVGVAIAADPPQAPPAAKCPQVFAGVEDAVAKIAKRFSKTDRPGYSRTVANMRDGIRRTLQGAQKHDYPVLALDDGTPIHAKVLAKDAFGEKTIKYEGDPGIPKPGVVENQARLSPESPGIPGGEIGTPGGPPGGEFPGGGTIPLPNEPLPPIDPLPPGPTTPPTPPLPSRKPIGNYEPADITEIRKSVEATLVRVENYQAEIKKFIDETASMAAEKEVLEQFLKNPNRSKTDFKVPNVPTVIFGADGKPTYETGYRYFDSERRLQNRIAELKTLISKRTSRPLSGVTEAENRALAQAYMVKRLEIFRAELMTQQSIHGGKPIGDAETQKLLDRISALYNIDKDGKPQLKADFQPPIWAWDKLRWAQLRGEIASFFLRHYPETVETVKQNKLVQLISTLTPEERRALGIEEISEGAGIVARSKGWRVIPTVLTGAGALGSGGWYGVLVPVYKALISDGQRKEECAAKPTEDEYVDCLDIYLRESFPKTYILAYNEKLKLLDPKGKINDPEILAEALDATNRRNKFMFRNNIKRETRDGVAAVVRDISKGDASVRQRIVEADSDDAFKAQILGKGPEDKDSYFAFQYPQNFANLRDKIKAVLDVAADDTENRQKKLAELRRYSPTIAAELEQMLVDREFFKQGFGFYNPGFPGGSPIGGAPGPIMPFPLPGAPGGTVPRPGGGGVFNPINNRPATP